MNVDTVLSLCAAHLPEGYTARHNPNGAKIEVWPPTSVPEAPTLFLIDGSETAESLILTIVTVTWQHRLRMCQAELDHAAGIVEQVRQRAVQAEAQLTAERQKAAEAEKQLAVERAKVATHEADIASISHAYFECKLGSSPCSPDKVAAALRQASLWRAWAIGWATFPRPADQETRTRDDEGLRMAIAERIEKGITAEDSAATERARGDNAVRANEDLIRDLVSIRRVAEQYLAESGHTPDPTQTTPGVVAMLAGAYRHARDCQTTGGKLGATMRVAVQDVHIGGPWDAPTIAAMFPAAESICVVDLDERGSGWDPRVMFVNVGTRPARDIQEQADVVVQINGATLHVLKNRQGEPGGPLTPAERMGIATVATKLDAETEWTVGPRKIEHGVTKVWVRQNDMAGVRTMFWKLRAPDGSEAALAEPTSVTTHFTPDVPGVYLAEVVVNPGPLESRQVVMLQVGRVVRFSATEAAVSMGTITGGETLQFAVEGSAPTKAPAWTGITWMSKKGRAKYMSLPRLRSTSKVSGTMRLEFCDPPVGSVAAKTRLDKLLAKASVALHLFEGQKIIRVRLLRWEHTRFEGVGKWILEAVPMEDTDRLPGR